MLSDRQCAAFIKSWPEQTGQRPMDCPSERLSPEKQIKNFPDTIKLIVSFVVPIVLVVSLEWTELMNCIGLKESSDNIGQGNFNDGVAMKIRQRD